MNNMTYYKLKMRNSVGDILQCNFYAKLSAWEICEMYEIQCNYEILKLEKIELKENIAYA